MNQLSAGDNLNDDDEITEVIAPNASSPVVIACEHACAFIPAEFDNLGLSAQAAASHIAWDPGALAIARQLSLRLDASLVAQKVSRLLYDCNRCPSAIGAIAKKSENITIPGNENLSPEAVHDRVERFYLPFKNMLTTTLDEKTKNGSAPILVTIHSFTPVYFGAKRDVEIGILHDADARLADKLIKALNRGDEYRVERNQPYGPEDGVTHTLIEHGLSRGALNVMIEVRNDLLSDTNAANKIGDLLADALTQAFAGLEQSQIKPSELVGN